MSTDRLGNCPCRAILPVGTDSHAKTALQGSAIDSVAAALLESAVHPLSASPGEPKNLFDLFAPVHGLLTDDEIDALFVRNRSMSRLADLS